MIFRAVLGLVLAAFLFAPSADAGGAGRLKFGRISGGGGLGSQTVYFGPWTHVGAGGADVCALPCVAPWTITSGAPLNFVKDSDGMLTTKDGNAGTAYNLPRTTGQLVSETFTITDSIGQTKTINAVVDASRAGTRTVANRPSVDNNSTSLPQWLVALQYSSYGYTVAWRAGSRFNTPDQSGYFERIRGI